MPAHNRSLEWASLSPISAFAAGASFVFQQAVNADLRVEIGSSWWAGFVSYLGGTIIMLIAALALREPFPDLGLASRSQAMSWTGGLFGAIYIASSILLLPRLGAATVIALIVAGQMIGSLAFDHFGLFALPVHQINAPRIAGALITRDRGFDMPSEGRRRLRKRKVLSSPFYCFSP
jgi:bacterial/archaeal transporter family-2 protein